LLLLVCSAALSEPPTPRAAEASQPQQSHASETGNKGGGKIEEPSKPAPIVNGLSPAEAKEHSDQDSDKSNDESLWKRVSDALIAVGTIVLAIITGVLAWYTRGLLTEARKQFPHFVRNVDAATKSAEAASQSALAAKMMAETAMRTERAWIGTLRVNASQSPHGWAFDFRWINGGKTPAIKCEIFTAIRIQPAGSNVPTFQRAQRPPEPSKGVAIPGVEFGSQPLFISEDEVARISSGEARAFIYGEVEYEDVFHDRVRRSTQVCSEVLVTGTRRREDGRSIGPNFGYRRAGDQNDAS
jgi:hypothetical protein